MKMNLKSLTTTLLFASAILIPPHVNGQSDKMDLFFKLSDYYFKKYVHEGLVDYKYASTYSKEINALYNMIGEIDLKTATKSQRKAFIINSYNLLVIYQVTKVYPLGSLMDKKNFFNGDKHKIAGLSVSLDELEKNIIFGSFKDPRIHFVLACAAKSCPELASFSYKPTSIDELLEERTQKSLNSSNFIQIDYQNSKVSVSKLFEWYESDFKKDSGSIINFINKYRTVKIPENFSVEYHEYDWTLNERKS